MLDDSLMKRTPLANWRFAQLMHTWLRGSRKGPNKRWLRRPCCGAKSGVCNGKAWWCRGECRCT